jgi:uncharacterized protein YndB with AHSA1/START domain
VTNRRTVVAEPGQHTIAFRREFEAPAAQVFNAHIDPDLVAQWIGPAGTTMRVRAFDPRTGGSWSYVVVSGDSGEGNEWAFHGSFHEVSPPNRIVQTWEYEGDPGHPTLEALTFTDLPHGRSRIDGLSVFLSVEQRDAMLAGMDAGMDEDFDRLEALLASG